MADTEKKRRTIINVAYYAMLLVLGFLFYKYAFGVCFPIMFAFFVAVILQRPKNFIVNKTPIKKALLQLYAFSDLCFWLQPLWYS